MVISIKMGLWVQQTFLQCCLPNIYVRSGTKAKYPSKMVIKFSTILILNNYFHISMHTNIILNLVATLYICLNIENNVSYLWYFHLIFHIQCLHKNLRREYILVLPSTLVQELAFYKGTKQGLCLSPHQSAMKQWTLGPHWSPDPCIISKVPLVSSHIFFPQYITAQWDSVVEISFNTKEKA